MKIEKGFTLVELLAVITLLSIILTITFSVINNVIKDSRENSYESQISTLESAAKRYISDNIQGTDNAGNLLVTRDKDNFVTIKKLQTEGYINSKKVIKNPKDDRTMTGCVVATYSKTYNQFQYLYTDYGCLNNDLFTPKINISNAGNGKYAVTITYPENLAAYRYVYRLSTNDTNVDVSDKTSVSGITVSSGTKITAEIQKGDYLVRQITEIA